MKLIPWTPRSDSPARMWGDTSRLFDRVLEDFFSDRPALPSLLEEGWGPAVPAVDILEKDGNLIVRAEMPGMNEKDIELKLEGNVLTLKGERKLDKEDSGRNYYRRESRRGSFSRSFTLPETIDAEKIKADYKNGVLTVTIPQKPEAKPRSIPVSVN